MFMLVSGEHRPIFRKLTCFFPCYFKNCTTDLSAQWPIEGVGRNVEIVSRMGILIVGWMLGFHQSGQRWSRIIGLNLDAVIANADVSAALVNPRAGIYVFDSVALRF